MPTFNFAVVVGAAVAGAAVAGAAVAGAAVAGAAVGSVVPQPAKVDKTSTTTSVLYNHLRIFSSPHGNFRFGLEKTESVCLAGESPPSSPYGLPLL
jgi:hypothetical protein